MDSPHLERSGAPSEHHRPVADEPQSFVNNTDFPLLWRLDVPYQDAPPGESHVLTHQKDQGSSLGPYF